MLILEILMVCFLGLVLGSFSTAIIYRVPRGIPWAMTFKKEEGQSVSPSRSACPHCSKPLQILDLIPLFSWLLNKGRCRHCTARISKIYPLTELLVLLICVLAYVQFGFTYHAWILIGLAPFLVALLVIDIQHMILPNQLVLMVALIGVLDLGLRFFVFQNISLDAVLFDRALGALFFALFIWVVGLFLGKTLKKEALGFGDVKFFGAAGLWLGFSQLPLFCIISGILGVFMAIAWQAIKKTRVFPFGPALILSLLALLLFDSSLFY